MDQQTHRMGLRVENFAMATEAARAGLGAAILPAFVVRGLLESGELVETPGSRLRTPSAYYFVAPEAVRPAWPVVAFGEWLAETFAREAPDGVL